tara:strand:- start:268 stop:1134 length:867 start_codon:yes stop_codon:yes gene_type:complete
MDNKSIKETLIFYNWMPVVSDWVLDLPDEFYIQNGVTSINENPVLTLENISSIKEGDVVFVKTDFLKNNQFQTQILPLIKVPFILVSGISSYTVDNFQPIIDSEKVIRWYATNPPCIHDKVIGLPIGFEEKERDGGNQELLKSFLNKTVEKSNKILLPYHTKNTNPKRTESIEYLKSLPFVEVQEERLQFGEYLEVMSKYKYCICLEGAGFDTHRNYECLLTGTVPIMKQSGINIIYDEHNLPCHFVDEWTDVNEKTYKNLESGWFDFSDVEKFLHTKTHMERIKNNE